MRALPRKCYSGTARPRRKRTTREQMEKRSGKSNADSRLQLVEDGDDSTRHSQMAGLPIVPYFPGRPVFQPHCPASRLGLPGTPNVPFFGRGQMVLKQCSKCMQGRDILAFKLKLGKLILRKIIKTVATRCHVLKLKYMKFDFGWGSVPGPTAGSLQHSPVPRSYI